MLAALYDRRPTDETFLSADQWANQSWQPLTADCGKDRCYGGLIFWVSVKSLFVINGRFPDVPLLEALESAYREGRPIGTGTAILDQVLRDGYGSSLDLVLVRMFVERGLIARVPPFPEADRMPPAATTPVSATFAARRLSATRIPVTLPPAGSASTVVVTLRSDARGLYPLLHLSRPADYLVLSDHDESTGIWTYRIPPMFDPARCAGAPCARGDIDLVALNTVNRPASFTVTTQLVPAP